MLLFSSSKWDHFSISLSMMNFKNILPLTKVRRPFSPHQNEIILEFLSRSWISTISLHWPTSYVPFFFITIISLYNFSQHDELQQYFINDQPPMLLFSSSKWDHFRISLSMMNSNNISLMTKVPWSISSHQNEIILEFLSSWWISTTFHHWTTSDALFLFNKLRWF